MTTTPASFPQINKFYVDALGRPSSQRMQYLLANSELFRVLAEADLSQVDPAAFRALLIPKLAPIDWTPVSEYVDRIARWNQQCSWGLTTKQLDTITELPDHAGDRLPTGVELTLGKSLTHDADQALMVLGQELCKLDNRPFTPYLNPGQLRFLKGSELPNRLAVAPALLDIQTFWNPKCGLSASEVRPQRSTWPSTHVLWLAALNPQVVLSIDYVRMPGWFATGLVLVGSDSVPYVGCDFDGSFVGNSFGVSPWDCNAVVSFRECQELGS